MTEKRVNTIESLPQNNNFEFSHLKRTSIFYLYSLWCGKNYSFFLIPIFFNLKNMNIKYIYSRNNNLS